MIKLSIGNNFRTVTIVVDDSTTIAQAFDEAGLGIGLGDVYFNGAGIPSDWFCISITEIAARHDVDLSKKTIARAIIKTDGSIGESAFLRVNEKPIILRQYFKGDNA